jgi:citrate lyase subunit beta/citryl-CoA lyase
MQMRSILVFPATQGAFEAALASEADALALDLSGAAIENPAALIAEARQRGKICLAQIHPLPSGRTDSDLDAVMPARPDGIILPDARGGRDVQHLGAKLAVREAENDFPDGATTILALAGDSPAALFELGSFARAGRRLIGLGRDERLLAQRLGVAAGETPEPLRVARSLCLFAAAAAGAPAYDCAEPGVGEVFARICAEAARDGFAGKLVLSAAQAKIVNAAFSGGRETSAVAVLRRGE